MTDVVLGLVGVMVLLAGVSLYSALKLAKRTDEIICGSDQVNEVEKPPMTVRFPESVFTQKQIREKAKPGT